MTDDEKILEAAQAYKTQCGLHESYRSHLKPFIAGWQASRHHTYQEMESIIREMIRLHDNAVKESDWVIPDTDLIARARKTLEK